jgi:hypothetical protein
MYCNSARRTGAQRKVQHCCFHLLDMASIRNRTIWTFTRVSSLELESPCAFFRLDNRRCRIRNYDFENCSLDRSERNNSDYAFDQVGCSVSYRRRNCLSDKQLNATAEVPGQFTYVPAKGAIPDAGTNDLSVTFYPDDRSKYREVTIFVQLKVNTHIPKPPVVRPSPIAGQRTLTDWQVVRLKAALSEYPGQKIVIIASEGQETHQYAMQFRQLFKLIHWNVVGPVDAPPDQPFSDLQVSISNNWDYAVNGKNSYSNYIFQKHA